MTVWQKIYDKFMTFWLKFMTIYDNIHETTKNSVTKIRLLLRLRVFKVNCNEKVLL